MLLVEDSSVILTSAPCVLSWLHVNAVGLYVAWCAAAGARASSWLWASGDSKLFDSDVSVLGRKLAVAIR